MSLDIWFREDIKHILMAAERASTLSLAQAEESASDPRLLQAYRRGYRAALYAVAVACGLTPQEGEGEADLLLKGGRS
ncbi:MAG: hypothetical protein K6V36_14080 [Anaerolineae bacterium]|jgi:hypothetical protein|nr:hypothetical protein [Anaerolineae bacterium]